MNVFCIFFKLGSAIDLGHCFFFLLFKKKRGKKPTKKCCYDNHTFLDTLPVFICCANITDTRGGEIYFQGTFPLFCESPPINTVNFSPALRPL